jgi:hypothetical protein
MDDLYLLYKLNLDPNGYWIMYDLCLEKGWAELPLDPLGIDFVGSFDRVSYDSPRVMFCSGWKRLKGTVSKSYAGDHKSFSGDDYRSSLDYDEYMSHHSHFSQDIDMLMYSDYDINEGMDWRTGSLIGKRSISGLYQL